MRTVSACLLAALTLPLLAAPLARAAALVNNPDFTQRAGSEPRAYTLSGAATYQRLGDPRQDAIVWGVALHPSASTAPAMVAQIVPIPAPTAGRRAFRFSIRMLAQRNFVIPAAGYLVMRVNFLGTGNKTDDGKASDLYPALQQLRHDLAVNGDNHVNGAAVWRTYTFDFIVPFADVTRLKLSVSADRAVGEGSENACWISDFSLTPLPSPDAAPAGANGQAATAPGAVAADSHALTVSLNHLLPIGGRWFYAAKQGENTVPDLFTQANADRLLYFDGQYETPFAGNMSSVLRAGDKDLNGNIVTADRPVPDNVTVRFDQTSMIIHTHGLPNHPTGKFPQPLGYGLLRNPNYITEQDDTYYIPLNPKENPNHTVTDRSNSNHALNMGPIGIAANGVVFFNPFDMGNTDASNFMDACCGHPNQDGLYHYHKYPICVNTPWTDDGAGPSPLLGWAFDGYPIYGPYESKGVMAKDLTGKNKLNAFNMHDDKDRGWHYHVTPGEFPYIIGGYWGYVDHRDTRPPHKMNGGMGGQNGQNGQNGGNGPDGMGGNGMGGGPGGNGPRGGRGRPPFGPPPGMGPGM